MFKKLNPKRGKDILIHGGSGGVVGFAIQLAKLAGVNVLTTCSKKITNM